MGNRVSAGVPLFNDDGSMVIEPNGRIRAVGGGGGGAPTGPAGGDLAGTYPNPTVDGIQGVSVPAAPVTTGTVLTFNGTNLVFTAPAASLPPSGAAGGDLSGTYPNPLVDGLQGRPVAATAPAAGEVLAWDGAQWEPTAVAAGGVTSVSGTAPIQSSGGATPVISLAPGTDVGDVYSWNGAAFDLAERSLRVTGITAPTGNLVATATAGTAALIAGAGPAFIQSSAGSFAIMESPGAAQLWAAPTGVQTYFNGVLVRDEVLAAAGAQLVQWQNVVTSLQDEIEARVVVGAGATRSLRSQDAGTGAGGALDLRSGNGSSVPGDVTIRLGSQTTLAISGNTGTVTIGSSAFLGVHRVNTSTSTSASPGAAETLPATPALYWDININGTDGRVPVYAP